MTPVKILVVDNDDDQRRMLKIILTRWGYDIRTADSAEAALEIDTIDDFDLVITDLIMPEMDGIELCEKIKERAPDAMVYAISGYAGLYAGERLDQAGFDGMIQRPFSIDTLRKTISAALAR